jgi:drug/metabolite transporter (DMT)-like permease
LGALVAIIHDFGVDAFTPQVYAFGFLLTCVVYGLVTNPRAVSELGALGQTHWIAFGVMAFCAGNVSLFFAAGSISGVELSALGRLYVPFCALFGMMFLGDVLKGYRLILGLTIIGVSLAPLASVGLSAATKTGLLLAVFAYFCFAIYYSILSAHFRKQAVIMNSLSAMVTVSIMVTVYGLPPLVPGLVVAALGGLLFSVSHTMFYWSNQHVSFTELNLYRALSPGVVALTYWFAQWKHFRSSEWIWLISLLVLFILWFLPNPFDQRMRRNVNP